MIGHMLPTEDQRLALQRAFNPDGITEQDVYWQLIRGLTEDTAAVLLRMVQRAIADGYDRGWAERGGE